MSAAKQRTGLGKGLGELLQRTDPELTPGVRVPPGARFEELPLSAISPNPKQPRTAFDEDELAELADSIAEVGLLQPIVVRPLAVGKYELVMGERRLRAAGIAGLEVIPAIIRRTEEHELLRDALLENLHRAQLNPLEEAAAYQQLMADFDITQEQLSEKIKRSRPQISNTIRLLQLPAPVQRRVAAGVLSAGHARALLALPDASSIEKMATRIVAEGLSVRNVEELVALDKPQPARKVGSRSKEPVAEFDEVSAELSERLETRVKLAGAIRRGRIVIDFAGEEDLRRIVSLLGDK